MSSPSSRVPVPDSTLVERVQTFVSENRRAVLLGAAAVVAAGGAAYYAASSSRSKARVQDAERADKKKKRKSQARDKDGPIIEERSPEEDDDKPLSEAEILGMTTELRASKAASLKGRGNQAYQARKFEIAADLYTRAIQVSPKPEPVFYSNRAACYVNMSPPKHDMVVRDCDTALGLDKMYVKAINRRASAHEQLGDLAAALRDFTTATILDKFQNESTAASVERVLRKLANHAAAETMAGRERRLPSYTFVSAYFSAFRSRPVPTLPEAPTTGDETLMLAVNALDAADYVHALSFVNEALEQGLSTDKGRARALNVRGTFRFLLGDVPGAKEDLEASLALDAGFTQTWVKLASVHMEQGDPHAAFNAFEQAITHDPTDPDIYYHRGQVLFIMNEFAEAAQNYTKSMELDADFVFSHIQLAVAQYKDGQIAKATATFRETLRKFPTRSEPHNYYGELLLDQGRFEDAIAKFDQAIELEKNNARQNVLPIVNKGLAMYQWKQDIDAAEQCCNEALAIDNECEAAVATLAQLCLQQNRIERAVELFDRQADLARSEPELANALTYKYASTAQLDFVKEYPEMASQMTQLARTMANA